MANFDSIKNQIVNELNSERLSKVLHSIIVFAQNTGNITFKQLCINELYGYDEGVELPKYRMIPVIFYDKDGNKITRYPKGIVISISEDMQQEYYPYRGAIENMENMAIESDIREFVVFKTPHKITIKDKEFVAYSAEYFSHQIKQCILELKRQINLDLDKINRVNFYQDDKSLLFLHENVIKVSSKLFIDGHYRQAVLDASIGLVNRVKEKSQCYKFDNTPLVQHVFSPNKPILTVSENKDIQLGIMWLFSGVTMAFRNVDSHTLDSRFTRDECLELLHLISYLHRILDKSKLIQV